MSEEHLWPYKHPCTAEPGAPRVMTKEELEARLLAGKDYFRDQFKNVFSGHNAAPISDSTGGDSAEGVHAYPDDNPKTAVGATKPPLRAIPPVALLHLGGAMGDGEIKYGRFNWRDRRVTASVYYDAMLRHLLAWWDGELQARDSGRHHLAHVMACCAIILDAEAVKNLNDDRRNDGSAADTISEWTIERQKSV